MPSGMGMLMGLVYVVYRGVCISHWIRSIKTVLGDKIHVSDVFPEGKRIEGGPYVPSINAARPELIWLEKSNA